MGGESGNGAGAGGGRQEAFGNIDDAMGRLQVAFDRFREEIEASARDEWVRAKPELRLGIVELQTMIDDLARRARTALDDLGARLEGRNPGDGG